MSHQEDIEFIVNIYNTDQQEKDMPHIEAYSCRSRNCPDGKLF